MRSKSIKLMEQIKAYVEEYFWDYSKSPSITQIAEAMEIARSTAYKYLVEMNQRGMISYDGKTITTDIIEKSNPKMIRVAVLGGISCGLPNFAEENIEEYVSLPESLFGSGEFYILRARGESMIDVGIEQGDLVVIRKQSVAEDGDIVVALVDEEATLKRFFRDDENKRIVLHPENKTMRDIYVTDCKIQGVAVNVIKDLH